MMGRNMFLKNRASGKRAIFGLLIPLALALPAVVQAGTLYRWLDNEGKKHVGTLIPPEFSQLGYEVLDSSTLRVIEVVPPPYTEEQLEEEARKEEALLEAERQEQAQIRADKALLDTYLNVDNMIMARDGQIATLQSIIDSTRSTVERLEANLDKQVELAASYERDGKKIPENILTNIAGSKAQILEQQRTIDANLAQQDEIRERFAKDIARFQELKGIP